MSLITLARQPQSPARANVSGRLHIYPRLRGHRVGRIIACIDTLLSKEAKRASIIERWRTKIRNGPQRRLESEGARTNAPKCVARPEKYGLWNQGKRRAISIPIFDLSFLQRRHRGNVHTKDQVGRHSCCSLLHTLAASNHQSDHFKVTFPGAGNPCRGLLYHAPSTEDVYF
jgi:hypothetical protein